MKIFPLAGKLAEQDILLNMPGLAQIKHKEFIGKEIKLILTNARGNNVSIGG